MGGATENCPRVSDETLPTSLECPRCGRADAYPAPGPFGVVSEIVGLSRFACRACRRHFWQRIGAMLESPFGPEAASDDGLAFEPPVEPTRPTALEGLDAVAAPGPAAPPDLSALDSEMARLRETARGSRSRRQKREPAEVPAGRS